jgi:hypothetical protein
MGAQRGGILSGLLKFILALQILVILVLFGYHYSRRVLDIYFNRGEIAVPSLVGLSLGDSLETAQAAGLSVMIAERRHSAEVPENHVESQIPEKGSKVRRGRRIQIVLSMGTFLVTTPEVLGKPFRTAGIILRNEGFSVGKVAYINDDEIPVDTVLSQNPRENSMVARSTSVDLLVSLGRAEHMIQVPDFIGLTLDDARGKLTRAGLGLGKISYTLERGESADIVLAQLPKKGLVVDIGSTVDLLVNGLRPENSGSVDFRTNPSGNIGESNPVVPGFDGSLESEMAAFSGNSFSSAESTHPLSGTGSVQEDRANRNSLDQGGNFSGTNGEISAGSYTDPAQGSATAEGETLEGAEPPSATQFPEPGFSGALPGEVQVGHAEDFGYFSSSMKKNVNLDFVVPEKGKRSRVQMVLIDTKGISKIYDSVHSGGEKLAIEATGYGKVKILIYVNRALVLQRNY